MLYKLLKALIRAPIAAVMSGGNPVKMMEILAAQQLDCNLRKLRTSTRPPARSIL